MGQTKIKTIDDSEKQIVDDRKKEDGKTINSPTPTIRKPSSTIHHLSSKIRGKKYQEALGQVNREQKYPLKEAVELAQKTSYSQFPASLDIHLNTTAKNLKGLVSLPHFAGRKLTILAFGPSTSLKVNTSDHTPEDVIIGNDQTIEEISKGKINFDILVATPEWMAKLAKVAKILGPKGLMPNPKNGTISDNLEKTIADLRGGKTEYRTESNGSIVHLSIGKVSQSAEEISANIKTLVNTIGKSRIKKVTLTSTMGPGVKIDLASI